MNSGMKQKMIISNVRFPESDWLTARVIARELGMSMNQFLYSAMQTETKRLSLGVAKSKTGRQKRVTGYGALDALLREVKKMKDKPMGASEDDKIIYGIDD